ncbi:hypothetical protein AX15_005040 [Amanita polypyramis BW_CC]|nr:hypothetical protein AX15_005040 [Amanita polypyramis BW_CC]
MTSADAPAHLLSLKVMRVSRPELASAWHPFYSSSHSFSAHSTAAITSLQGTVPLTGHPKTLRDFTYATELLTLPSTFGSIQLGETFSSCLCVNNEASVEVADVGLKIEIQTANGKHLLADLGGTDSHLIIGGSMEKVVGHEIKELGQHVLACTVTYRLPPGVRGVPGAAEEPSDPSFQTFRKFYKFVVSNPLSVKTKVHSARSPSAMTMPPERDKVFLEVHIQNLCQQPLYFEQMRFECAEDWEAKDANIIALDTNEGQEQCIYSNSMALIQPQDTRQYVYILSPRVTTLVPIAYAPGNVVSLGRLNISWRSSFGEPGRLLTSMLSRRIPLATVPPQQQPTALSAHLKRSIAGNYPSRPQSPQLTGSRPSTPPGSLRPSSPSLAARTRPIPSSLLGPIQTPSQAPMADLEVTLVVRHIPRREIVVEKPFTVKLALVISHSGRERQRVIRIAIQYLQPRRLAQTASAMPTVDVVNPKLSSSGMTTPTSAVGVLSYAQSQLSIPRSSLADDADLTKSIQQPESRQVGAREQTNFPPPFFDDPNELETTSLQPGVVYVGSSIIFLPRITLGTEILGDGQNQIVQEFEATYVPLRKGFISFGGLRALLVEDRIIDTSDEDKKPTLVQERISTLKEWNVVGDIWVTSCK